MTATEALEASAKAVARRLTRWEVGVDGAIHAVAIIVAIFGAVTLLIYAARHGGAADITSVAVYSAGLIAMLGCSAAYNLCQWTRYRIPLRNLDQAAIFLMIAGTYTPFTVLHLEGPWRVSLTTTVWLVAVAGILFRLLLGRLFERVSVGLYLALGWLGLVAIAPLAGSLTPATLILLAVGGVLYSVGVVFHVWQRLPFQTPIWHAFVVAAAATHFAAIAVAVAQPA
jgi:hemolysin III